MVIDHHHHEVSSFAGVLDSAHSGPDLLTPPLVSIPIRNNNNLQYYSEIAVGSSGQKFNVIPDTGSDRLWVPSTECVSSVCKAHQRFDASHSASFAPESVNLDMKYGTGSVQAKSGIDSVSLGGPNGIKIDKYPISVATSMTRRPFNSLEKIDGIFGISQKSRFTNDSPNFSFYLSNDTRKAGTLSLRGIDANHIDKEAPVHFHPTTKPGTWNVELVDIKVGDQRLGICGGSKCHALIDTGSSLITGPPRDFDKLIAAGVSKNCTVGPHSEGPVVTLIFRDQTGGEVEYPLTQKEYSINFQDDHKECKLGFGPLDMGKKQWVIGDTFLRRYVSVFDNTSHRIGLVRSHHDNEEIGVLTSAIGGHLLLPAEKLRRARINVVGSEFLF